MGISAGPFLGDAFEVTALPKCFEGIDGQAFRPPPLPDHRPYICSECILQDRFGFHEVATVLHRGESRIIDKNAFRIELLRHFYGLNHGFDFALQVMTLINHVGDVSALPGFALEIADLMENTKDLIGDKLRCASFSPSKNHCLRCRMFAVPG